MHDRYSRQQLFSPIGELGQQQLQQKHVLIVGVGALGSATAEALTRAGIGTLTLIDRDFVEWSNLQRQQLYTEQDAIDKLPKVIAAKKRLQAINHSTIIHTHIADASEKLPTLLPNVDSIIDATDNFDIRFLLNDLAAKHRIPWVYGSCVGSYGAYYTILPNTKACLRCLYKTVANTGLTCDTVGIISPAVQLVAAYQVAETLKILVGDLTHCQTKYVMFDAWQNSYHAIDVTALSQSDCPTCGTSPTYPALHYENQTKLDVLCGRDAVQIRPAQPTHYDLNALANRLRAHGETSSNPYLVTCQLANCRVVIFQDGRAVIHGISTIEQAKIIYYRLLG